MVRTVCLHLSRASLCRVLRRTYLARGSLIVGEAIMGHISVCLSQFSPCIISASPPWMFLYNVLRPIAAVQYIVVHRYLINQRGTHTHTVWGGRTLFPLFTRLVRSFTGSACSRRTDELLARFARANNRYGPSYADPAVQRILQGSPSNGRAVRLSLTIKLGATRDSRDRVLALGLYSSSQPSSRLSAWVMAEDVAASTRAP